MKVLTERIRIDFERCGPKEFLLEPGTYSLEVIGAGGGDAIPLGGHGGRSVGTLRLTEKTMIVVNIGEKGIQSPSHGSFSREACNGGGTAFCMKTGNYQCPSSGGGSTDIRIGSNDILKRVIVAGGGGGAGTSLGENGGDGGGKTGGDGEGSRGGRGGQETWCPDKCKGETKDCAPGRLLYGGNAPDTSAYYSGGGGGLIGGAAGRNAEGGGGGSGYVFSENAKRYSNITTLDEKYLLTDAYTETSTNTGNGFVIISPINIVIPRTPIPTLSQTPRQNKICSINKKIIHQNILIFFITLLSSRFCSFEIKGRMRFYVELT